MDSNTPENHPLNLNSPEFNLEMYVNNLVHKKGLDELVAIEEDMVQNVRRLDSEMQQLVYENYSKFLSATNTVRSMQDQFSQMCNDLNTVSSKIDDIFELNDSICNIFVRHRSNVKKLNDSAKTVKGLQFVVKLPQLLQICIDKKDYKKAVQNYCNVKHKLIQYKDVPSMSGIYNDTMQLINEIEDKLRSKLTSKLISSNDLVESVQLLKELGILEDELEKEMINTWKDQINKDIELLKNNPFNDLLEFAENGCCNFLTTISIAVSLYPQLFPNSDNTNFNEIIDKFLNEFNDIIDDRFKNENDTRNCAIYVRALDRIYRKLQACVRLINWKDYSEMNNKMVINSANHQINAGRNNIYDTIKNTYNELIIESEDNLSTSDDISKTIKKLEQIFLVSVKTTLANLLLFTANDITFSTIDETYFFNPFTINVFEQILVGSIEDLIKLSKEIILNPLIMSGNNGKGYIGFANFLNILKKKHITYLIDLCQEQFRLTSKLNELTQPDVIIDNLESISKMVLKSYVDYSGSKLNELSDKYLVNNNWLKIDEPKTISNEIKDITKCVINISKTTSILLVDSPRKERSTESKSLKNYSTNLNFDTGSISSAIERIWADKAESLIVVEFFQESIMLAITKICLRSLIENIRLSIFSTNGLQQLQVDSLYLKNKLWESIPEEHALNCLFDDIISSAINQCDNPRLLEPNIAKRICENSDK